MKSRKVILIMLFLSIMAISAVSASEDASFDNMTAEADSIGEISLSDANVDEEQSSVSDNVDGLAADEEEVIGDGDFAYAAFEGPSSNRLYGYNVTVLKGDINNFKLTVHKCTANYTLIVDGQTIFNGTVGEEGHFYNISENLELGKVHTWSAHFSYLYDGGSLFDSGIRYGGSFNLSYYDLSMPDDMQLNCLALFSKDAKGRVIAYFDDKMIANESLKNFILRVDEVIASTFGIDEDVFGKHNFTLRYEGENYPSFTKTSTFDWKYYFAICFNKDDESNPGSYKMLYGSSDVIYIFMPSDVENSVNVSFNGKNYTIKGKLRGSYNCVEFKISPENVVVGRNVISATYLGDKKYPVQTVTESFDSYAQFITPYNVQLGVPANVSLTLPKNATGYVQICQKAYNKTSGNYDEAVIHNASMNDGKFSYIFDTSVLKYYNFTLRYVGGDYHVDEKQVSFYVVPAVSVPNVIYMDNKQDIVVKLPENVRGNLTVILYDMYTSECIVMYNGSAEGVTHIPTAKLNYGQYDFEKVIFKTEDYSYDVAYTTGDYSRNFFYMIYKPKLTSKASSLVYNFESYSVTVYGEDGKLAGYTNVVFKVNGKKIGTVQTDSKGVATIKINNAPGTYKITAEALGISMTKKVTVKHALSLKTVKVKKSAKKLFLTATLKNGKKAISGKKITFKFNGKKLTGKTNSKGVAKVTFKNALFKKLKVGKKVAYQATFLKDTVKKTAIVKK